MCVYTASLQKSASEVKVYLLIWFYVLYNESKYESFTFWNKLQEKMNIFTLFKCSDMYLYIAHFGRAQYVQNCMTECTLHFQCDDLIFSSLITWPDYLVSTVK